MALVALTGTVSGSATEAAKNYLNLMAEKKFDRVPMVFHPDAAKEFGKLTKSILALPAEKGDTALSLLFDGVDPVEARKMDDAKRFGVFVAGMQGRFVTGNPALVEAYKNATYVGEIAEGDTTHVLIRLKVKAPGAHPVETYEVFSFKKDEGEWKLLLTPKLKQPLLKMKAMFG